MLCVGSGALETAGGSLSMVLGGVSEVLKCVTVMAAALFIKDKRTKKTS